jgi:hypothetical protein
MSDAQMRCMSKCAVLQFTVFLNSLNGYGSSYVVDFVVQCMYSVLGS